jgi:SHS2 domain-containing protein
LYEIFEHTADLGLLVRAASLSAVCEDAAGGLTEIIAGDSSQFRPSHTETFEIHGREPVYLLFDWLNELLYAFESRRMLFSSFEVTEATNGDGLLGVAHGECYDPRRHLLAHEVKAITYHGLEVKRVNEGPDQMWEATVIVDI